MQSGASGASSASQCVQICKFSWGMLKLEFKRTCMKQIFLLMIEPSRRAEASELIIYLLKSFLLFPNKEFRVSLAGSGQIIRDGPECMCRAQPSFRCCGKLIVSLPPKPKVWLIFKCIIEIIYRTLQRRYRRHNVKEDKTILLQLRSRDEEAGFHRLS